MPSPSDILGYRFRPRGADQSTLYFHARVRNRTTTALSLTASLDGVTVPVVNVPAVSGWQWVSSPVPFTALDTTSWHWLRVMPGSDSLDLDLVALKRSISTFSTQAFSTSIAANTVCLGDTTRFTANLNLPAGCIDFHWDFGDGRSSYETDPVYVYPYPGVYEVVFTAWHACLDSTVTDTIQVLVVAPMVDAGPPGMVCPDTSGTLAGSVQPGTTFSWLPDSALSSTTVLDPIVQGGGSQYFYLQGTLNGCSMTDSVWVVFADTLSPQKMPDDTVCLGTMIPLWVNNVHTVWWDSVPGIVYGQGCSPCFTGTATQVLTWHATDACHCDTVTGQVTVTVENCCAQAGTPTLFNPTATAWPASTAPLVGGAVHIVDTFIVDANISFANKVFWMDSAAVVRVLPGFTLTCSSCTWQASCPDMWQGIRLEGPSAEAVMLQTELRDAYTGLLSEGGAAFRVEGCTFRANLDGIMVRDFAGPVHPGLVSGTKFLDGTLITPQPGGMNGHAGIVVRKVKGLTIGVPGTSPATENLFEGMVYGIEAQGSTVDVFHNRFRNIVLSPNSSGPPATYCGILATGDNSNPLQNSLSVGHPSSNNPQVLAQHRNHFENCQTGVRVDRAMQVYIRGNNMDRIVNDGVFVRRLRDNVMAVSLNTFTRCGLAVFAGDMVGVDGSIARNTITGDASSYRNGIRLDLVKYLLPVRSIEVTRNNIELRGNGIFVNTSSNVNIEDNTIRLIRQNAEDILRGIYVGSSTQVRVANNPSISSSGAGLTNPKTMGIHVAWSPETSVKCNTIKSVARSAVFEGECFPSDFLGNTMRDGVDGFTLMDGRIGEQGSNPPGGTPVPCGNVWLGSFSNSQTNVLGTTFLGNQSRFFVRNVPLQKPIDNEPFGTPSQMIPNILPFGPTIPVNCYSSLPGKSPTDGIKQIATNRMQGNSPEIQASQFRADEWAYSKLLQDTSIVQADTSIATFEFSISGSGLAAACVTNAKIVVPDSLLAGMAASQITQSCPSEANHKTVIELRLSSPELDSIELSRLMGIASQCEALGGKGVNIARGLLAGEGIRIWDDPGCPGSARESENEIEVVEDDQSPLIAKCWPNPTGGSLNFEIKCADDGTSEIRVFDLAGKVVLSTKTACGFKTIELPETAAGLHLVEVLAPKGASCRWVIMVSK